MENNSCLITTAARGMDIPRAAAYFIELPQWDLGKLSGGSAVRIGQLLESGSRSNCSTFRIVKLFGFVDCLKHSVI